MGDTYLKTANNYNEIVTALEDEYIYGNIVKFSIPGLVPFMSTGSIDTKTKKANYNNIVNKTVPVRNEGSCVMCNYLSLHVPVELSDYQDLHDKLDKRLHDDVTFLKKEINNIKKHLNQTGPDYYSMNGSMVDTPDFEKKSYTTKGKIGDQFLISFAGGDLNSIKILERVNK